MPLTITLEFSGGAELLFDKVKRHVVDLPESKDSWKMKALLPWIRDNLLKERPELFMQGNTVILDMLCFTWSVGRRKITKEHLNIQTPRPHCVWLYVRMVSDAAQHHAITWRDAEQYQKPTNILHFSKRPGILVLVNDADWELMGELDYEIQNDDCIVFISTLHGG